MNTFTVRILTVVTGLFFLTGIISLAAGIHFAVILFGLGSLVAVIGAYLGGPDPYAVDNPRMQTANPYGRRSAKEFFVQKYYDFKNTAPTFSFENIMLFAGCITVILSLPFLCSIMF